LSKHRGIVGRSAYPRWSIEQFSSAGPGAGKHAFLRWDKNVKEVIEEGLNINRAFACLIKVKRQAEGPKKYKRFIRAVDDAIGELRRVESGIKPLKKKS